jgi:phage baseplate assembly protein W
MSIYKGFSTIGRDKKFVLTDYELVKRDLLNAFTIKQGEVVGRPLIGSMIWTLVFENQTDLLVTQIKQEVKRVIAFDKRVQLDMLDVQYFQNGVLISITVTVLGLEKQERFGLYFDRVTNKASFV